MADDFRLRLDQARGAPIAERKQAAELVDQVIGVEADCFRVVADEGAGEDARGPFREVVALESDPEIGADLGDRGDGFDADAPPLTFAAEAGTEGVSFRPENSPEQQMLRRSPAVGIVHVLVIRTTARQPDL